MSRFARSNSTDPTPLEADAIAIWQAGVNAVDPLPLVADAVRRDDSHLQIGPHRLELDSIDRIAIVGGGKAVDAMACGAVAALQRHNMDLKIRINAMDSGRADRRLSAPHRRVVRHAGQNEPTDDAVQGTEEILALVESLGPRDVCLCLLSGGGSAMLAAPADGIALAEKLNVIRRLSAGGADIKQLNTVRRCLSKIKGGGLAARCGAGRLYTLVISDVLGDALETIASGPTVLGSRDHDAAIRVLEEFSDDTWRPPVSVTEHLRRGEHDTRNAHLEVHHILLANIQTAIDAATDAALQLGYQVEVPPVDARQPDADTAGEQLAEMLLATRSGQRSCLISGGEPTVRLAAAAKRGRGGRNQQLALAALRRIAPHADDNLAPFALLSGGTDGEDGPTDAAGAVFGADIAAQFGGRLAEIDAHLARNDAYSFFDPLGCLLKTGPTGTNVCDLRVILRA